MAIAQDDTPGPSAESLSLAASVFTSQISSWIPANFGQSTSASASTSKSATSLESIFQTEHERGERLGLGHPLLEVPRHQRQRAQDASGSSSLSTLGKRLGLDAKGNRKGKGRADEDPGTVGVGKENNEDEDEEEESRASIGKKRKVDKVDVWSGKKKAKTKAKAPAAAAAVANPSNTTKPPTKPTNDDSPERLHAGAIASHPGPAVEATHAPTTSAVVTTPTTLNPELAGLNKNQRKKLRKKQKLLAQQSA